MQTEAHKMGREERRALLEQRRAAVARQLRRLAIELTDIDRQLDEIEQSERWQSAIWDSARWLAPNCPIAPQLGNIVARRWVNRDS